MKCSFYAGLPPLQFDFMLIDGPCFRKGNEKNNVKCFNSDLINILLNNSKSKVTALNDQRLINHICYKKLMPNADITYDPIKKLSIIRDVSATDLVKL